MGTFRRYRGIVVLAIVLAVGFSVNALARPDHAGPAEKATGGIMVQETSDTAWVDFNAHEAKGKRDAKGTFWWYLGGKDDPTRTIKVDVEYVMVDGDMAWFAGMAVMDTDNDLEGEWFFVKVKDGGTPATDGDQVWWEWVDDEETAEGMVEDMTMPANEKDILAGNLVVHTYGGDE